MSERVRARREAARAREKMNQEMGLPSDPKDRVDMELHSDHDLDQDEEREGRDTSTMSPRAMAEDIPGLPLPLFQPPQEGSFNYQLPLPFNTGLTGDNPFTDFESAIFKPSTGATPNFSTMFGMYDDPPQDHRLNNNNNDQHSVHGLIHHSNPNPSVPHDTSHHPRESPNISPPHSTTLAPAPPPAQPELLTRLKQCCHLSDSHVVNDPGLLIFATRLCQSFPCTFSGVHPDSLTAISDSEHLLLEDSWRALRNQLDPGTDLDGENRINTGRMAAELVIRAAHSRGQGGWILCRFREGMSIRRSLVAGLVNGLGGNFE